MVYMPAARIVRAAPLSHGRLAQLLDTATAWLSIMGAATRVARAVEDHRRPCAADLERLGLRGKIAKYY